MVGNFLDLLQRTDEFQTEEAHFARGFLTQDFRYNGGSLTRNHAGSGRARGGDRQMDGLIRPQDVCRSDASSSGADIKGLGEFDELCARYICSSQEDRYLQANPGRASG